MGPIQPIVAPAVDKIVPVSAGSFSPAGTDFGALLSQAVGQVENGQQQTSAAMDRFLSGEDTEVHQVALVAQKAEMQFDLFMQVRNKVIAAYQEVMKMQL
ncbi:MAG TPA: flagellar hook-basal body complex protein FliE [Bryobacteraceae bacterium]|nr:flagellar hook-basal body complex protein FliE [Bryobacteraceae bacterium]